MLEDDGDAPNSGDLPEEAIPETATENPSDCSQPSNEHPVEKLSEERKWFLNSFEEAEASARSKGESTARRIGWSFTHGAVFAIGHWAADAVISIVSGGRH